MAVGDGVLRFWAALEEVYPTTRIQRCGMHKTGMCRTICRSQFSRKPNRVCMISGWQKVEVKLNELLIILKSVTVRSTPRQLNAFQRIRESLLTFYDFPAEHWIHIRTTNVIESSFATIRHRTRQAKGCVTRITMMAMIYKMGIYAEDSWRKLKCFRHLAKVIEGVKFKDGIEVTEDVKAAA